MQLRRTTWACTEGVFGGIVGAHICGNYTFGGNATNDSVYTPTATGATVTIGGDDAALAGGPQTLANAYSTMTLTDEGSGNWKLSNGVVGARGYDFVFSIAGPVDLMPVIADGSITTFENNASAAFVPTITLGDGTAVQHTLRGHHQR